MSTIIPNAVQTYVTQAKPASDSATPNQTMIEVMNLISAHTADVFVKVLGIVSTKYGHTIDDMMEVIRTHPDYHTIYVPPVLTPEFYRPATATAQLAGAVTDKKSRGRPKKGDATTTVTPQNPINVIPVNDPLIIQKNVYIPPTQSVISTHIIGAVKEEPQRIHKEAGNTPSLTGADTPVADTSVADIDRVLGATRATVGIVKKKVYRIKSKTESLDLHINRGVDTKEVIPHSY